MLWEKKKKKHTGMAARACSAVQCSAGAGGKEKYGGWFWAPVTPVPPYMRPLGVPESDDSRECIEMVMMLQEDSLLFL